MGKGQEVVVVKKNIGNSFLAEGMRRNDGIVFFDGNKILKNGLFHYLGLFIHLEGETKEGATCRKDYKMFEEALLDSNVSFHGYRTRYVF